MLIKTLFSSFVITFTPIAALVAALGAAPALAQSRSGNYNFLVASGFLCDPDDSSTCRAEARAANGDSIEMSGAGIFNVSAKSATGAGSFVRKAPTGAVLETGVWTARKLVSFKAYGIVPAALTRQGRVFKALQTRPLGFGVLASPLLVSGVAELRISLFPHRGGQRYGILQVNSTIDGLPPDHSGVGIRLTLEGGGEEFDEEVGGQSLLILANRQESRGPRGSLLENRTDPARSGESGHSPALD